MEPTTTVKIVHHDGWDQVQVKGALNEKSEAILLLHVAGFQPNVVINLREVVSINSCGVRSWIHFLREAEKGRQIVLEECAPFVVFQLNTNPSFRGAAEVKSVYAGCECPSCGHQKRVCFEKGRNMPYVEGRGKPEPPRCPECQTVMVMDETEESFFAFLREP